jgi:GNAT superfamily N-acetyltransferase
MTRPEVDIAIDWAAKEGWNPGVYDADCFYVTDPKGFFIGLLGDKPVSCISAVAYNEHFGFMGFYLVKQEYRGKGYGIQIWNRAIAYLKTQNIGLDGVVTQQENYKKSGFKLAYRNIRYRGATKKVNKPSPDVEKLSDVSFGDILLYDNKLFPASRPQFLESWINLPESMAFGVRQKGKLVGYSVIRKCREGYKIGPLFANNGRIAEELFLATSNGVEPGSPIFLDTPEINPAAVKLARRHRMEKCFETARMYSKKQPNLSITKVFGVTTFELG